MAITVSNIQESSTDTLLYTPSSVTDSCLFVAVSSEDVGNNEPITSVMFGATPMVVQEIGQGIVGSNANDVAVAYLINPGVTGQTITVTGGQHDRMGIAALTLDNVDQSTPVDASQGTFNNSAVSVFSTTATTSNANSFVVSAAVAEADVAFLSVTGATEILEFAPPSSRLAAATSLQSIAGTYSHEWTSTISGRNAAASIAFNLASAGGISITPTLGTISYSSQSASISLTGSVDVVTTLGTISYSSQNTSISLTGEVDVNATLGLISYNSQNASVSLSGEINVNPTLGAITYSSQNTTVSVTGDIDVISTLGAINYTSNNTTVNLSGAVDVISTLGSIDYSSQNTTVTLAGLIDVNTTLGSIVYNSYPVIVKIGTGQAIGNVTAGFADDIYTAGFKPDTITVSFK